ncbi:MAG: aminopeptidase P family protein [Hyphomicrobiaceae bacterium]|nr:aminopeptidase P family protein [Hyphomicrobiaceae bacterium]
MFQTFNSSSDPSRAGERVAALRAVMRSRRLDAYFVPRADEHQGEYVPPAAERLAWLTGFTGSAGFAVIGLERAALFVDGRYTVQARTQVDADVFEIVRCPPYSMKEWVLETLPQGAVVGFDPRLATIAQVEQTRRDLGGKSIRFKEVAANLVDKVWGSARPKPPQAPVLLLDDAHAGQSAAAKIERLQARIAKDGQDAAVLTQPDSICWLLNIRGGDVAHNPVVLSHLILHARGKPELFIDAAKLDAVARKALKAVCVLRSPDELDDRLGVLKTSGKTVRLSPGNTSWAIARRLGGAKGYVSAADPTLLAKAIKNDTEIDGARQAHQRDGVAMVRFLAWLETAARKGTDEIAAVQRLEAFRADTGKLREISFDTISGSGANGAIVHYRVTEASNRRLGQGELFLIDSGAQYIDGTTDITRTVAIGRPTPEMCDRFTRVLKGHIAIATARFPVGTRGLDLDSHARMALWSAGLDYDHGTGHGVGSFLSVHEGPQAISRVNAVPLEPGMILSNEPGYYKEGEYGIRIENLVLVTPPSIPEGGERPMLGFETLTLAPIDRKLVVKALLSDSERRWLDAYHARVAATLERRLDAETREWLTRACRPL